MSLQITPEIYSAWQLKKTISKVAKSSSRTNQNLIEPFELGLSFNSQYLAVGIIVENSRDSWQHGGRIAQEFKFPNFTKGYLDKNAAFNYSQDLLINRVTFVQFPPITSKSYKVHYFPPRYFTDVKLQIWQYTGITADILLERLTEYLANLPPDQLVDLPEIKAQLELIINNQNEGVTVDLEAQIEGLILAINESLKRQSLLISNSNSEQELNSSKQNNNILDELFL